MAKTVVKSKKPTPLTPRETVQQAFVDNLGNALAATDKYPTEALQQVLNMVWSHGFRNQSVFDLYIVALDRAARTFPVEAAEDIHYQTQFSNRNASTAAESLLRHIPAIVEIDPDKAYALLTDMMGNSYISNENRKAASDLSLPLLKERALEKPEEYVDQLLKAMDTSDRMSQDEWNDILTCADKISAADPVRACKLIATVQYPHSTKKSAEILERAAQAAVHYTSMITDDKTAAETILNVIYRMDNQACCGILVTQLLDKVVSLEGNGDSTPEDRSGYLMTALDYTSMHPLPKNVEERLLTTILAHAKEKAVVDPFAAAQQINKILSNRFWRWQAGKKLKNKVASDVLDYLAKSPADKAALSADLAKDIMRRYEGHAVSNRAKRLMWKKLDQLARTEPASAIYAIKAFLMDIGFDNVTPLQVEAMTILWRHTDKFAQKEPKDTLLIVDRIFNDDAQYNLDLARACFHAGMRYTAITVQKDKKHKSEADQASSVAVAQAKYAIETMENLRYSSAREPLVLEAGQIALTNIHMLNNTQHEKTQSLAYSLAKCLPNDSSLLPQAAKIYLDRIAATASEDPRKAAFDARQIISLLPDDSQVLKRAKEDLKYYDGMILPEPTKPSLSDKDIAVLMARLKAPTA